MKKIKLNNEFLLVDGHVAKGGIKHEDKIYYYFCDAKNITEEQASEIVYKRKWVDEFYLSYKGTLNYILKSKGIHLYDNPYTNSTDLNSSFFSMQTDFKKEKEAEEKTFYNPFIFKL